MIPIRLSIQGLYSYQDIQEIDFQPLTNANVFGIFGKVGSGKTSLLEAISFALYGETERLHSRDNRPYNMMNLKSKQLKIDFEFRAGPELLLYRFMYETKRHPKKHADILPGERRMFVRRDDDWHPIGSDKEDIAVLAKQLIGLDYANFKRTIIIPQNQFREFLELSPTDRTKMMNQLFRLEQYDLASRTGKLLNTNTNQLAELRGLLAPLAGVTPERLELAQVDIDSIQQQLSSLGGQLGELVPLEQRLLYLRKQHTSLLWARDELTAQQAKEPGFRAQQQQADQYERCTLLFQNDFASLTRLQQRRTDVTKQRQNAEQQQQAVSRRLPALLETYLATKDAYENREQLQQRIDELDDVQRIRAGQESVERLTRNRVALDMQIAGQMETIDQLKAERQHQQEQVSGFLGKESKLGELYKIQNWFDRRKPMQKQADSLQEQLDAYDRKLETLKQRKNDSLAGFDAAWTSLTLKTLPDHIHQSIEQLRQKQQVQETAHQQALVRQGLQQYADHLTDGTPCPLCGSTHHPDKLSSEADETVRQSETVLTETRQKLQQTTDLQLTIKGLETELRATLEDGKRLTRERADAVLALTEHDDTFVWPDFDREREETVAEAIAREDSTQKQLQDAQKTVQKLTEAIDEADAQLKSHQNNLNTLIRDIDSYTIQITTWTASLTHYTLPDVANWTLVHIADLRTDLTERQLQVKTDFEDADETHREAEKQQAILNEQLTQLARQLDELCGDIDAQQQIIDQNLQTHALTREQVDALLSRPVDTEKVRQQVREFEHELVRFQSLVSELETELTDDPFEPEQLALVTEKLQAVRTEINRRNTELGGATNVLKTLNEQWAQKQAHQQRHDELDLRQQDLKKMEELFRAQGFVNYVSSVYLKNLCESANERFFKLTNNQLRLEVDEKNNFQVRDYLNGGETRSVKTLSGGQTFQASLSLALALSDNIQHMTQSRQNLFFLDEGFGTLDKDSLQTVFKTLKALRSENRVVGIISHVEELQQEVDTYIRAEAGENGSRIVCSWNE